MYIYILLYLVIYFHDERIGTCKIQYRVNDLRIHGKIQNGVYFVLYGIL